MDGSTAAGFHDDLLQDAPGDGTNMTDVREDISSLEIRTRSTSRVRLVLTVYC